VRSIDLELTLAYILSGNIDKAGTIVANAIKKRESGGFSFTGGKTAFDLVDEYLGK
jgi:hypothetical protein